MFQTKILSLIAEGENERIELKRELMLDTAERKAEFIKDIIALANSASDRAYLLIGVNDRKEVVGSEKLEEERIQQIVSAYIDPPAVLRCALIQVQADPPLQVGVIEVRPTGKPHKVARSIGRLSQNDVFVRHGSVVEKASPEEIIRMHQTSRLEAEKNQFVRAAETHLGLDNLEAAIKAYSNAIEIFPSAELFLARGKTYYKQWQTEEEHIERNRGSENYFDLVLHSQQTASLAIHDFSDALKLSESPIIEKEVRFYRYRILSIIVPADGTPYDADYEWLQEHTEGREQGEVLYLDAQCRYNNAGFSYGTDNILSLVDRAINLGYLEAPVLGLRAEAHYQRHNLGLALTDLADAIKMAPPGADLFRYVCLKAAILVRLRKYAEANDSLSEIRKLSAQGYGQLRVCGYSMGIEATDILYQLLIPYEYGLVDRNLRIWGEVYRPIVQYLTLAAVQGKYVKEQDKDGRWQNVRATVAKTYPLIAFAIREVVGEDFWQANRQTLE